MSIYASWEWITIDVKQGHRFLSILERSYHDQADELISNGANQNPNTSRDNESSDDVSGSEQDKISSGSSLPI